MISADSFYIFIEIQKESLFPPQHLNTEAPNCFPKLDGIDLSL